MAARSSCAAQFPEVQLLRAAGKPGLRRRLERRLSRRENDIVVLLNSDMRVEPDFLAPLLAGFRDRPGLRRLLPDFPRRSRQAPRRNRPDAGLVAGWRAARAAPRRPEPSTDSSLLLRRRRIVRFRPAEIPRTGRLRSSCSRPFYLEDTDLGFLAWKRGWKVLYQPRSVVHHEHRGTIGKRFQRRVHPVGPQEEFPAVLLEEHSRMAAAGARISFSPSPAPLVSVVFGDYPRPAQPARASGAPFVQLPERCDRAGGRAAWPWSTIPKHSGGRSAAIFTTVSRAHSRRPSGRACFSFRPIPSARRRTAAACSCITRCARLARAGEVHVVNARLRRSRRGQRRVARLLRDGRVLVRPADRQTARSRLHPAARRARVRQRRSEWLIQRQTLSAADRRDPARIHGAGAIRAALTGAWSARCSSTTSISSRSAAGWVHAWAAGRGEGPLRISARHPF